MYIRNILSYIVLYRLVSSCIALSCHVDCIALPCVVLSYASGSIILNRNNSLGNLNLAAVKGDDFPY